MPFLSSTSSSPSSTSGGPTTEWKVKSSQIWIDFCNNVEQHGGETGEFIARNVLKKIVVNAPVLLSFVLLCTILHVISMIMPKLPNILGVDDRFTQYWNPFSYISLFSHVLAHSSWNHLKGNMVHLLLVGPAVEHEFGSKNLLYIILVVALSSSIVHLVIGKYNTYQLGASGVVFALILLSSLVTASHGTIPLSFILVATWWIGDEIWKFFFAGDGVSHHAHICGGIVGTLAGYYIHQQRSHDTANGIASRWLSSSRDKKNKKRK